jgi:hypothetical protein
MNDNAKITDIWQEAVERRKNKKILLRKKYGQ